LSVPRKRPFLLLFARSGKGVAHGVPILGDVWERLQHPARSVQQEEDPGAVGDRLLLPESSIEIVGHSVGGITYQHDAHRAPLAFKAIMTIRQPTAFSALIHGHDGECPCCRRQFADAG
jgi:hypothetical protein